MAQRVWIIGSFCLLTGGLWFVSLRLTPHRGVLRGAEGVCLGVILCYCLGLLAAPLGIVVPQGPASAVFAGTLGLPGAALSILLGAW